MSLTWVLLGRLGCDIDHLGALGGQNSGCVSPHELGCNHSPGALSGRARQTGRSRRISCIQTQCLSVQSKSIFLLAKPHSFIGLNKFNTGRFQVHQMRSGTSYLRAQPSCDSDLSLTYPRCQEALETFNHGILVCSANVPASERHLQVVSDLIFNTSILSSGSLLGDLSQYIRSTIPTFALRMLSRPTSATLSVPSCSSTCVFFEFCMSSQEN